MQQQQEEDEDEEGEGGGDAMQEDPVVGFVDEVGVGRMDQDEDEGDTPSPPLLMLIFLLLSIGSVKMAFFASGRCLERATTPASRAAAVSQKSSTRPR